jgi:hypothetical protein
MLMPRQREPLHVASATCLASTGRGHVISCCLRGRFVVRGTTAVAATLILVLSVPALQAQVLYTLESPFQEQDGWFGYSVSGAGNVNSDFYDDLIVGAPAETYLYPEAGSAYLYTGATGAWLRTLLSPNAQDHGWFGQAVSGAGDVNSDGYDDVVVGASLEDDVYTQAGRAYIFNGQTGGLIYSLYSPNEGVCGRFGWSVSGAGDVNSDGYDDVVIGAPFESPPGSPYWDMGRAYVFSGQTSLPLYTLIPQATGDSLWFGFSVSGAGDVNSDGYDDVIVGARGADNAVFNSGAAYVFSGQTGSLLHTLVSPYQEIYGRFGKSVSGAGDVNSDGYDDVVVGAPAETYVYNDAGSAYVFNGLTGGLLRTLLSPNPEFGGRFGESVSGAGDVNLDGFDDVVVGAAQEDPGTSPEHAGRAYIFSGQNWALLKTLASPNEEVQGHFGYAVSCAGDVNSSGYPEVIVGAYGESPGTAPSEAGRAYVYSPTPGTITLSGYLNGQQLVLYWSPCIGDVYAYWVYGAPNSFYFQPGILPPYTHRLALLGPGATGWQTSSGIGNPNAQWSYRLIAVDITQTAVIGVSNRFGEHDFSTALTD